MLDLPGIKPALVYPGPRSINFLTAFPKPWLILEDVFPLTLCGYVPRRELLYRNLRPTTASIPVIILLKHEEESRTTLEDLTHLSLPIRVLPFDELR